MTLKQSSLKPVDVVVGLQLALTPDATFNQLATSIGVSTGEAFNSVRRLGDARLLQPTERRPVRELLLRFMVAGVPFCFPPVVGPNVCGVATGLAGPLIRHRATSDDVLVWAHANGDVRGRELAPLFRAAPELPSRNPALYGLLTLVDVLRTGQVRERQLAEEILREQLLIGAT